MLYPTETGKMDHESHPAAAGDKALVSTITSTPLESNPIDKVVTCMARGLARLTERKGRPSIVRPVRRMEDDHNKSNLMLTAQSEV